MAGARQRSGQALSYPSGLRHAGPRTALLGGSFNPAHGGHRRITVFTIAALALDEAWWLVSPGNPLKPRAGMAPLAARFASARRMARRAPIRVTAIERQLGTRYTLDTLRALRRRFPKRQFVWVMGADNLAQFHHWHRWRDVARIMPIAVVGRPGYDRVALASPAMAWLRRYRTSAARMRSPAAWSAPALIILHFDPDTRSATDIRRADPLWADPLWTDRVRPVGLRDDVTHRPIAANAA